MALLIGIDPGANGAMCMYSTLTNNLIIIDFKKSGITGYANALNTFISNEEPLSMIAIEKVASRSGQGVKSMFSFGQRLGELEGMLQTLNLGYTLVPPKEWQKACGIPPKSDKKGIYHVMSRIYPEAQLLGPQGGLLDGRCDALGITHYLRKTYGKDAL